MKSSNSHFTTLEATFGVEPQKQYDILPAVSSDIREQQIETTENYVETELKNTINQLDDAINRVNELGELSEQPGAYRVLGELASTKVSALKELRELRKRDTKQINVGTVNNTQVNTGMNLNEILRGLKSG